MEGPDINWNEVTALYLKSQEKDLRPGKEWFTQKEYEKNAGISQSTANQRLHALVDTKKAERVRNGVFYYRLV